ncbi:MAG: alpha/beta fold hydrolase [Ignavibacteriales bacterium]|nr:alpha/beta fold hydrolase [Ignavibacteriales bacterium]
MKDLSFNPVIQDPNYIDLKFPPSMKPILIKSDDCKLLGTFFIANGINPHPTVILLHGFPGNQVNFDIAHAIQRAGFNVLIFRYRGCWGSEGKYSFKSCLYDIENTICFLRNEKVTEQFRVNSKKIILIGHSMGGFFGLMNCIKDKNISDVAALSVFNPGLISEYIKNNIQVREKAVENLKMGVEFCRDTSAESLIEEMLINSKEWNLLNYTQNLMDKNILLVGSEFDSIAPAEFHHKPLAAALKLAKVKNLDEMTLSTGHSFTDKRIKLTKIIIDWLLKINN